MTKQKTLANFPLNTLAVAVTAAFLSQPLAAQSNLSNVDSDDINTIVVVGQATSGLDNLITEEELEQTQANSLSEIFRNDPAVSVGGPVALAQKVHVRDIGEKLINITVDGAKLAASTYHHSGRVSIEPELLKRVEVEAGAGSATAGPGALGGSILFTTKDPEDLLEDGQTIGALLKGTYSSNGAYFKKSATVYARSENNGVSGMINILDSDKNDMKDGDGNELPGTESKSLLGFAKIVFNLNDEHKLSISHETLNNDAATNTRPEWYSTSTAYLYDFDTSRDTNILNYSYQPTDSNLIDFSINLFNTKSKMGRVGFGEDDNGAVSSKGATIENTTKLANHEVIYGANYIEDHSEYETGYEEKSRVWGIYAQDIIAVSDELTITTGLRYDNYSFVDLDGDNFTDDGFSPNISANYDITDQWSISAGYAEAMKGLSVQDAFVLWTDSIDYVDDIHAERSTNIELGLNFDSENYSFSAGIYKSSIEDYIDAVLYATEYYNLDEDIKTKGIFLRGEYQKGDLTLGASAKISSIMQNGQKVTRYQFPSGGISTGDTLQLSADYKVNNKLRIGWNMEHVNAINDIDLTFSSSYGINNLTIDKPAYTVHDIYAEWKPTGKDNLKVNFSINNLFNENYLSHSSVEDFTDVPYFGKISGFNEAGRDARISVAYKF